LSNRHLEELRAGPDVAELSPLFFVQRSREFHEKDLGEPSTAFNGVRRE
jgi:hypothetical protein